MGFYFRDVLALFCLLGEVEPGFGHLLQPAFLLRISGRSAGVTHSCACTRYSRESGICASLPR
jgi:hypothetical protein